MCNIVCWPCIVYCGSQIIYNFWFSPQGHLSLRPLVYTLYTLSRKSKIFKVYSKSEAIDQLKHSDRRVGHPIFIVLLTKNDIWSFSSVKSAFE